MASRNKKPKVVGQVNEDEFVVEKILDKKNDEGVWKYLIKWSGWPSETNTWEPEEHLNCKEILSEFEKQWAIANPELAGKTNQDNPDDEDSSNYDSDEEETVSKDKTRQFMDFDIMDECPPNKEPKGLIGVVDLSGTLTYLVEWKKDQENMTEADEEDRSLIRSTPFQLKYPALVIQFYEKHISFSQAPDDEVVAHRAAQSFTAAKEIEATDQAVQDIPEPEIPTQGKADSNNLDTSSDSTNSDNAYEVEQTV